MRLQAELYVGLLVFVGYILVDTQVATLSMPAVHISVHVFFHKPSEKSRHQQRVARQFEVDACTIVKTGCG